MVNELYRRSIPVMGELIDVNSNIATPLAAAGTEDIDILVPEGYIYKIHSVLFQVAAPSGAASGTHRLTIYNDTYSTSFGVQVSIAFNNALYHIFHDPSYGGNTYLPADRAAYLQALKDIIARPGENLRVRYTNSTDVAQANSRVATIVYEKIPIQ